MIESRKTEFGIRFRHTMWKACVSILLITALGPHGCEYSSYPIDNTIIVVGSKTLDSVALQKDVKFICSELTIPFHDESRVKEKLIDRVIDYYLVLEFGKKNGIRVSQQELEEKIEEIRGHYGEESFSEALLQAYISEEQWTTRFRDSLLVQKICAKSMESVPAPTYKEAKEFFEENPHRFKGADDQEAFEDVFSEVMTALTHIKRDRFYAHWLKELRSQFEVRINQELLKQVDFS